MKINVLQDLEKYSQMLKFLQFGTVMVFLDSRHPDVVVPEHLKGDPQLRLNFDYAYEIDDFRILPDRLEASLSFNRVNFFCVIPFDAVYLFVSHSIKFGVFFEQSVPPEMVAYFAAETQKEVNASKRYLPDQKAFQPEEARLDAPQITKKHLRLVKS